MILTHKKYPSLIDHYNLDSALLSSFQLDQVKKWFITEKIHGANFAVYFDGTAIKYARRYELLTDTENFFGYQALIPTMKEACDVIFTKLSKPFIIYGELCGGFFGKESNGAVIQKEVQYCPENQFLVFDIFDITNDKFLSIYETWDCISETNLATVPWLGTRTTLEDALAYNVEELSIKLQADAMLPLQYDNFIEGIVIRPNLDLYNSRGNRFIIKKKSPRFADAKDAVKIAKKENRAVQDAWTASYAPENIDPLLTQARTVSAISKVGRDIKLMRPLIIEMTTDVLAELGDKYNLLPDSGKSLVTRYLGAKIPKMLREEIQK